jgi:tripartite-type tricarboxylate transporter receptor subunit TctC
VFIFSASPSRRASLRRKACKKCRPRKTEGFFKLRDAWPEVRLASVWGKCPPPIVLASLLPEPAGRFRRDACGIDNVAKSDAAYRAWSTEERSMSCKRRSLASLILIVVCLPGTTALAQYPSKYIRIVVPFAAGGAADIIGRALAQSLGKGLGQPVIVEDKPGADGMIAADSVRTSSPDGYTLLLATNTAFSAAPILHKVIPYNAASDFTPVAGIGNFGFFVYVNDAVPAHTLEELLDYARANPGKLAYGTGNSTSIIATARLAQQANVTLLHVPYKGDAPMTVDLIGGRVQMAIASGGLLPHVKDGKLRVLATLLSHRTRLLPDVPTLAEAGLEPLPLESWGGIVGPARMPKEIVERLSRELGRALAQPEVREVLENIAFQPQFSSPEKLGALVVEQIRVWAKLAKDTGITAQ